MPWLIWLLPSFFEKFNFFLFWSLYCIRAAICWLNHIQLSKMEFKKHWFLPSQTQCYLLLLDIFNTGIFGSCKNRTWLFWLIFKQKLAHFEKKIWQLYTRSSVEIYWTKRAHTHTKMRAVSELHNKFLTNIYIYTRSHIMCSSNVYNLILKGF